MLYLLYFIGPDHCGWFGSHVGRYDVDGRLSKLVSFNLFNFGHKNATGQVLVFLNWRS